MPGILDFFTPSGIIPTRPIHKNLTVQVLTAVVLGVCIGALRPDWGMALKPLADGFIKLVKLVVGPIVFLTIVGGIAGMGDLKRAGRVGLKALVYFEIVTTIALAIGLVVANMFRPGAGINTANATGHAEAVASYAEKTHSTVQFFLGIIPDSVAAPFVTNDSLQVLFLAVLFGIALAVMGPHGSWAVRGVERLSEVMFCVVAIIMKLAPLGALGAMAFTVGQHGVESLASLAKLMGCVYATMAVFVLVVLGVVLRACGVGLLRYLWLIRDEILLVLGTSSSESALPRMIQKMRRAGCGHDTAGLVIPTGYSFNLDGTSIYLSMAVVFIAQAYHINMSIGQQITVLGVLMLTSKGAAAVTGGGFITLTATLTATRVLPVEGLALLFAVDRFMSEARAITNLIGNGVAAIAVSRMEGEFDAAAFNRAADAA